MSEPPSEAQVLDDIRRALGHSRTTRPAPLEPFVETVIEESREELTARFIHEITLVGAAVYRAESSEALAALIAQICGKAGSSDIALSGSPALAAMNLSARLAAQQLAVIEATDFSPAEKDRLIARLATCGAGVTTVDCAIAETGTLVTSSDEEQALLVSLLPVLHIAVLRPGQILATLTQAIQALAKERMVRGEPCRSATFITGPSRTSDVELTLSIGVHGPKELHLILFEE
jgi:L-lactate dehydrogenase complex protein LldG